MLVANEKSYLRRLMEYKMATILKWIIGALVAAFLWLVAGYTDEYFRPYKKIRTGLRKQ